jgi:hypothetical protein
MASPRTAAPHPRRSTAGGPCSARLHWSRPSPVRTSPLGFPAGRRLQPQVGVLRRRQSRSVIRKAGLAEVELSPRPTGRQRQPGWFQHRGVAFLDRRRRRQRRFRFSFGCIRRIVPMSEDALSRTTGKPGIGGPRVLLAAPLLPTCRTSRPRGAITVIDPKFGLSTHAITYNDDCCLHVGEPQAGGSSPRETCFGTSPGSPRGLSR